MSDDSKTDHVETLLKRAVEAHDSGDAMRFAQAASNAANALCAVQTEKNLKK